MLSSILLPLAFSFAPLRQKMVSAITAGVVPDIMEYADFSFLPLNAWDDKLIDVPAS
jgi:hypothetical protein